MDYSIGGSITPKSLDEDETFEIGDNRKLYVRSSSTFSHCVEVQVNRGAPHISNGNMGAALPSPSTQLDTRSLHRTPPYAVNISGKCLTSPPSRDGEQ